MSKTFCIFSAHYLPHIGGVEKYTENLALELAKQGHRIIIVTSNVYGLDDFEAVDDLVEILRLPCYKLLGDRYPVTRHDNAYRSQMEYLQKQDIDYVAINTRFYRHTLEGIRLAEAKGIRPVVIDHGSAHLTLGNPLADPVVAWIEHAITSLVKRHPADYYAVSQAGVHWLKHFDINALGVLNNSIDAYAFLEASSQRSFRQECGIGDNALAVTFTGRLIPEKGIAAIIDAARLLIDNSQIHFFVAGDGPLETSIAKASLPNISFLGRLETSDISALLQDSDVFCLPSRSEGFSTSLLEAAACGNVPVITEVGGVQELIPSSDYGIVLPSADPIVIARELAELESDRKACCAIGSRISSRVVEEFSWSKTAALTAAACEYAQRSGA